MDTQGRRTGADNPRTAGRGARSFVTPHRCNDRLEDVMMCLADGQYRAQSLQRVKLLWQCMRSAKGMEPAEPPTLCGTK